MRSGLDLNIRKVGNNGAFGKKKVSVKEADKVEGFFCCNYMK